ncbi:CXXX repeat peptide modification system protein [Odoribacter laneus]|uniref:CXXX repeat peptide modification system protein n=1 Tax=Odoribacter laneus TaxID=626933 RepID=UPI003AF5E257
MKKMVGKITEQECDEIQKLFERKNGLNELAKIVKNDDALYEKLVVDMGVTSIKFQKWWNDMAAKYQWESRENSNWEVNFDTCEIYLVY